MTTSGSEVERSSESAFAMAQTQFETAADYLRLNPSVRATSAPCGYSVDSCRFARLMTRRSRIAAAFTCALW